VQLIYCFEKKGVLSNPTDDDSVISAIKKEDFQKLCAEGTISGGMIPKLENALEAINGGVCKVIIGHANDIHQLINHSGGTVIC